MTPTPSGGEMTRARLTYVRYLVWFYAWKWTRSVTWLHRRTIRPVNEAQEAYIAAVRALLRKAPR